MRYDKNVLVSLPPTHVDEIMTYSKRYFKDVSKLFFLWSLPLFEINFQSEILISFERLELYFWKHLMVDFQKKAWPCYKIIAHLVFWGVKVQP